MTKPMTLEEFFEPSNEELARLKKAPFPFDSKHWYKFARRFVHLVLQAYRDGEVDLHRMIALTRNCSLGCVFSKQKRFMAYVALAGLRFTPKTLNRKRPPHPEWVRRSAGHLIEMLMQVSDEPMAPSVYSSSSKILENATACLIAAGLYEGAEPVGSRQLYDWYLETMQADGHDLKVGRPRKKTRPNSKTGEI